MEDKENSYKAGISGTVKVRESPQPLKAEVSFIRFTPAESGAIGAEVSEIIFFFSHSIERFQLPLITTIQIAVFCKIQNYDAVSIDRTG